MGSTREDDIQGNQKWSRARSDKANKKLQAIFLFHFILTKNYYLQGTENYWSQMTLVSKEFWHKHLDLLIPTKIAGFGLSF